MGLCSGRRHRRVRGAGTRSAGGMSSLNSADGLEFLEKTMEQSEISDFLQGGGGRVVLMCKKGE